MLRPRPRQHTPGTMNKLEQAYAMYLHAQGIMWRFEPIKLKLAKKTWYTPDFLVITEDAITRNTAIEMHEVKGFWRDDARVKWKVAAELYPWFRFVAVTQKKGAWHYEYYD